MRPRRALLVSDIHLPTGPSEYREQLLQLIKGPASEADVLYLLGDIFEYWLGDDVSVADHSAVVGALRRCAEAGTRIRFICGNRDFLVGRDALSAMGAVALPDPVVVRLPDGEALLSHGDIWCTSDVRYQRWRRIAHNPLVQGTFRCMPVAWRRRTAQRLRRESADRGRVQAEMLMDVDPAAVAHAHRAFQVNRIIHGHTHRPAIHGHDGRIRIVLPDWRPNDCRYLSVEPDGISEHRLN